MALPKRVMRGGSYYKGYTLAVAGVGNHILNMSLAQASAINGITIVPDTYGAGDYFTLEHIGTDGTTVLETLADTVYNVGANAAWEFDFASLELMGISESFRLTYTSVSGTALNVYTCVERIK
jgi:hypothetical protein